MKLHFILGVLALGVLALAGGGAFAPALAAVAPSPNDIAWGDAVAEIGESVSEPVKLTLTALITGVLLKYAGPFGMFIRANYVSDLVDKAVNFAFAATLGAQRGKSLSIDQMPEFMRNVLLFANSNFPWVLRFVIKNVRGLVEMALARITAEAPAEFRYTPAFAFEVEQGASVTAKPAPVSALLSRLGLVGA